MLFMNNSKKIDRINLSDLSISNIISGVCQDQSSQFPHSTFLLETIKQIHDQQDEYGLSFLNPQWSHSGRKQELSDSTLQKNKKDSKAQKYLGQSGKKKLVFSKSVKRKRNALGEKQLHPVHSDKVFITKPVAHIKQYDFKGNIDTGLTSEKGMVEKQAKKIKIFSGFGTKSVETNLYQLPLKKQYQNKKSTPQKKLYHLCHDDIVNEINDYNCELLNSCWEQQRMNARWTSTVYEIIPEKIKGTLNKKISVDGETMNLNDTQTCTHASVISGKLTKSRQKIFEIKRYRSVDRRHKTTSCLHSSEILSNSSPISRQSVKTTNKQTNKRGRNYQYFVRGCSQKILQ